MQYAFRGSRKVLAVACALVLVTTGIASAAAHKPKTKAKKVKPHGHLTISSVPWGTANGQAVRLFTLENGHGMIIKITNYGGVLQSIDVPDKTGHRRDVALGFPSLSDYVNDFNQGHTGVPWPMSGGSGDTYFGAIIGRYANRIANHSFTMSCDPAKCSNSGNTYTLPANNGTNTLHGGDQGWNTKVWSATSAHGPNSVSLALTYLSPDMDEGFPAPVLAKVVYTLTNSNALQIHYSATNQSTSREATVINLTNHTYFNLAGEGSGPVYNQLLAVNAGKYTVIDPSSIPTPPYFVSVAGTPFDFRALKAIGRDIHNLRMPDGTAGTPYGTNGVFKQLVLAHGYDHNWVLNGSGNRLVAVAQAPGSGIVLWTYTDQPGVQVYTGNFLVGDLSGPSGRTYRQGEAFTEETQHYPDTPHHIGQAGWPSVLLYAGSTFTSSTTYRFTASGTKPRVHF